MNYKMHQANELMCTLNNLTKIREEELKQLNRPNEPEPTETNRLKEIEKKIEEVRNAMKYL